MKQKLHFFLAFLLAFVGVTQSSAEDADYVYKEKLLYKTNFQDWEDVKADKTKAVAVEKQMKNGETLTFYLYNTAVDNDGIDTGKFTAEGVTAGYLQTQKDPDKECPPYIETSAISDLTKFEIYQAATGGTRGITVSVKGDGDADWVELHNKSIVSAKGELLSFTVNRKNCKIKIGSFVHDQNAYVLSMNIYGNVLVPARKFVDFKLDLTPDPYTVTVPSDGILPAGVVVNGGEWHDKDHGYSDFSVSVPVDGPVEVFVGGCKHSNKSATVSIDGNVVATLDTKSIGCTGFAKYTYNKEEPATLTIYCGQYCPSLEVKACDYIEECTVTYYDTDNTTVLGTETVEGSSKLAFKYSEKDVTVPEGQKFRGWFNGKLSTSTKVAEGLEITEDIKLYARATDIENVTNVSHFIYDLTKPYFYIENHEAIEAVNASYYNEHGWVVAQGGSFKVKVGGKAYITIKNCQFSKAGEGIVTDEAGKEIARFNAVAASDGAATSIKYDGEATTLTITYPNGAYVHGIEVACVREFVEFDETLGYYKIPANDVNSFLLALADANSKGDVKIFLPNGTYDLGEITLTSVSGKNISIIGESMEGTIIKNAPLVENEGIGTTATLVNTSSNLYLQDLTLQNALDYYKSGAAGRAVCLHEKGSNTICKNVRLLSYQDTYYSNKASKFYWEDSEIHGTVDYMCGDGDVIYNRCKLVNESRAASGESGDCTVCAPYHSAECKWGYVYLDCTIDTKSKTFNLGRSWGGESKAVFIRTTLLQPEKLVSSRFTAAGMNVAAYGFYEYGTMNASGENITPASNVINFTHSTGNKQYETILTDSKAAEFTIANIFGEWAPESVAAQKEISDEVVAEGNYETVSDCYLATVDGATSIVAASAVKALIEGKGNVTLRAANDRGGFGPAKVVASTTGVKAVSAENGDNVVYDLLGRKVKNATKGIFIINGVKVIK